MTFTYDETEPTNRDVLRGRIADTVENAGPRVFQDNRNYSDELLDSVLSASGTVKLAQIEMHMRLYAEWMRQAGSETEDKVSKHMKDVADFHRQEAERLREEENTGSGFVGFVTVERCDQWNSETTQDEYS